MTRTLHKKPQPSTELQILTALHTRMNFSANDRINFTKLYKGHLGERKFSNLLVKELSADCIIHSDLLLESNQTEFQIDSLLIFPNKIFPIEVKNFEGDFYVKEDKWYAVASGNEIRNPLLQIERSEFLLRQFLQRLGYKIPIEPYLVFVNPKFTLYQAPFHQSIVFPGQLQQFMKKLNANPGRLQKRHRELSEKLARQHIVTSSRERLPIYAYEKLKKGITCSSCKGFLSVLHMKSLHCERCDNEERIEKAVMRMVTEFQLLFPERKITTSSIYDWCQIISSKKRIRRILMRNMTLVRKGRSSHYIF